MSQVTTRSSRQALHELQRAKRTAAREALARRKQADARATQDANARYAATKDALTKSRKRLAKAFKENDWAKGRIIQIGWRRKRLALYVGNQFDEQQPTYIDHRGRLYVSESRKSNKHYRCLLFIYSGRNLDSLNEMLTRALNSYTIPE